MRKEQERCCASRTKCCDRRSSKLGITLCPAPGSYRRRNATRNDRPPLPPAFELRGQLACSTISRLSLALQTTRVDRLQISIECRCKRAQFRCRVFAGLLNYRQRVFAQERRAPGE